MLYQQKQFMIEKAILETAYWVRFFFLSKILFYLSKYRAKFQFNPSNCSGYTKYFVKKKKKGRYPENKPIPIDPPNTYTEHPQT